ncbi:MAG: NAD(+) diphosphatase [Acidimicrobiia bacterium]|nr:NAD(+) diphosphatase [Acidimicrobiia bacterium]
MNQRLIDPAAHRRGDEDGLAAEWNDDATRVLVVGDGHVPVDPDGHLVLIAPARFDAGRACSPRLFLGVDDCGRAHFAVAGSHDDVAVVGRASGLREAIPVLGARDADLAVRAVALANWHATHTHCSRCGHATDVAAAGHLRRCPADTSEHFPRTDPAVIVLIVDGDDRALLGRHPSWGPGRFATFAGFVEPGESLEQAVHREVGEEVGLRLEDVQYVASQPWPFPSSLMIAFSAKAVAGEVRVDGVEIEVARWFSREDLMQAIAAGEVVMPGSASISSRLIEGWYGTAMPAGPTW